MNYRSPQSHRSPRLWCWLWSLEWQTNFENVVHLLWNTRCFYDAHSNIGIPFISVTELCPLTLTAEIAETSNLNCPCVWVSVVLDDFNMLLLVFLPSLLLHCSGNRVFDLVYTGWMRLRQRKWKLKWRKGEPGQRSTLVSAYYRLNKIFWILNT